MIFEKTYTITPGPAPLPFDDYRIQAKAEYEGLLATATDEAALQSFLENNPCFVPRASAPGSHGPLFDSLISKPVLPGLRCKIPDFMWITSNSSEWYPTLVEIECPTKRLFRDDHVPSALFTQARDQISEWKTWFADATNVLKFISEYGVPDDFVRFKVMKPNFVLIYGRRREFQEDATLSTKRSSLMSAPDEILMSFDRLKPDEFVRDVVTVRANGSGRYSVIAVTPTLRLSPVADGFFDFGGLAEAIDADHRISAERRRFLCGRLPHWKTWKAGPRGFFNTGDYE